MPKPNVRFESYSGSILGLALGSAFDAVDGSHHRAAARGKGVAALL